jgi:membrane protease YdiL (CAAX protease family)
MAYLGAQVLVWSIVGVVAAARAAKGGGHGDLVQALSGLVPVALPGSLVAGGIALLLVLRRWRKRLGAAELGGILGLSWSRPRQVVNGVLGGAALALLVLPLMALVVNRAEPPDLMTQLAGSSNSALRAWMISAVLLAPPIEELMFRGVLYGALANTWNIRAAAFISGTTFWLMHGPEFVHWPAAVAIALLTILATWLRVRSQSLAPSIAAHFGYNLVLATVISIAMVSRPGGTKWARDHHLQRIVWTWGWTANARW